MKKTTILIFSLLIADSIFGQEEKKNHKLDFKKRNCHQRKQ